MVFLRGQKYKHRKIIEKECKPKMAYNKFLILNYVAAHIFFPSSFFFFLCCMYAQRCIAILFVDGPIAIIPHLPLHNSNETKEMNFQRKTVGYLFRVIKKEIFIRLKRKKQVLHPIKINFRLKYCAKKVQKYHNDNNHIFSCLL